MTDRKSGRKRASTVEQELRKQLEASQQAQEELRNMVEQQTAANAAVKTRLAVQTSQQSPTPWSELMVGIRNCSDNTIGIPGKYGNADVQLHANLGSDDPGQTAIISYAWYREIRKDPLMRNGMIRRDDSILGTSFTAAPADSPGDLPAEHYLNLVIDPQAWIESRSEPELIDGLEAITSMETLQRIRRVVDVKLKELESTRPRTTRSEQAAAAQWALSRLPSKYRTVDEITSLRIEERDLPQEPGAGRKIHIK